MSRVNKRDLAKKSIVDIADYLGEDSILVSARFLDSVERTLEFLLTMPEIAGRWESDQPRLRDVRVWPVDGFPNYLLFYRVVRDGIDLIYVCHGSRNLEDLLGRN